MINYFYIKYQKYFEKTSIIIAIIFATLIFFQFYAVTSYLYNTPPSFDGAMNLNVAASFARGEGYGFVYNEFFPFPAQTDGPLILPAAFVFFVAGIDIFNSQLINLIYLALFSFISITLFRYGGASWSICFFGVLVCFSAPGFVELSTGGLGELIVLFWFLSGLVVLSVVIDLKTDEKRKRNLFLLSGALFSMSYLTKVVALLCIFSIGSIFLILILRKRVSWKHALVLFAGFMIPLACWEIFRFFSLAGWEGYLGWWKMQLGQILFQSGASSSLVSVSFFEKLSKHFSILSGITHLPFSMLAMYLVTPYLFTVVFLFVNNKRIGVKVLISTLSLISFLYFLWWLLITPTIMAWPRRIFNGIMIHQILIIIQAIILFPWVLKILILDRERNIRRYASVFLIGVMLVPVGSQAIIAAHGQWITRPPLPPNYKSDLLRVVDHIKALPSDAVIFGTGWWKAPVLSLLSGRNVMNLQRWDLQDVNEISKKYLVADREVLVLAKREIDEVLDKMDYKEIFQSDGGSIFEIINLKPYKPFSEDEIKNTQSLSKFTVEKNQYPLSRGIDAVYGDRSWARPQSGFLLKRSTENLLILDINVPSYVMKNTGRGNPQLRVYSEDCIDKVIDIVNVENPNIKIRLNCSVWQDPKNIEITLSINRKAPVKNQIDADARAYGFLFKSAELTNE